MSELLPCPFCDGKCKTIVIEKSPKAYIHAYLNTETSQLVTYSAEAYNSFVFFDVEFCPKCGRCLNAYHIAANPKVRFRNCRHTKKAWNTRATSGESEGK